METDPKPKYDVAERVLDRLGGVDLVAKRLGKANVTLYRWRYPKEKGGTDGLIPSNYHHDLLRIACEDGKPLAPADFFDLDKVPGWQAGTQQPSHIPLQPGITSLGGRP